MQALSVELLNQPGPCLTHTLGMNSTSWQSKAQPIMRAKKIAQKDIADFLSVSESTVSHWFHGRHRPSLEQIRGIAKLLGVSVPELIEDDETFVRDDVELEILRQVRLVAPDKREQAAGLVSAILATLKQQDTTAHTRSSR
jgi:transcriptional regulator with XRE-family HTH domain